MTLVLEPGKATLTTLEEVYRGDAPFRLDRSVRPGIDESSKRIREAVLGDAPIYGVSTGFGNLASARINRNNIEALQRNLILSHSAGTGPIPPAAVTPIALGATA